MIGKTISHYKILEKLGEGGMGVVYKAEDTKLERTVALKFLPSHYSNDADIKARFKHEAKAAAALNHPNIVSIHEIGEHDGRMFLVMEYTEGESLCQLLAREELSIDKAINLATQVCAGLSEAHQAGIVHRDIKPANILIDTKGRVRIADFGLAKTIEGPRLTKEQSTLGTVDYMSPEQARGEDVDHRSDIFSFGVVLYEIIAGQRPFQGDYHAALTYSIVHEQPEPLVRYKTGVSEGLQRIVDKALDKNPGTRYQHIDDLLADLNAEQNIMSGGVASRKPQTGREKRNVPMAIGTTLVTALVVITGYFLTREPASTERIPIAVVDFVNETKEAELSGLSGMLITALEQSRRLHVFSRARMYDEFKQMNRPDLTFVDENAGREISKRANIHALAVATIRNFDDLYTIDFKVIDPQTGDRLFSAKVESEGKKSIPGMLDDLAKKTRIDLKEQDEVVQLATRTVADVTTTNLAAYQHYFLGEQLMSGLDYRAAQEEYRKAITLDTTFGLAYYRLANAMIWGWGEELAKEPLSKAFELIDRIPDKEKYLLRALAAGVEKGWAAGIPIAKEMERYYPDDKEMLYYIGDWSFHARQYQTASDYFEKVMALDPTHEQTLYHLATVYSRTNRYDKFKSTIDRLALVKPGAALEELGTHHMLQAEYETAIEYYTKALEADSTWWDFLGMKARAYWGMRRYTEALGVAEAWLARNPVPAAYDHVARTYIFMGDLPNAEEILNSGLQHFPNSSLLLGRLGRVSALRGNYEKAEAQLEAMVAQNQPALVRRIGFVELAYFYAYLGKYSKASKMYDERIVLHWSDQDSNSVARYAAEKAHWLYLGRRDKNQVYRELEKVRDFQNITNEDYYYDLARVYNHLGDYSKASKAAEHVTGTVIRLRIESVAWMAKKEWDQAIAVNQALIQKWRPEAQTSYGYFSAVCYYEKGELDRAIQEVTKAASFYGWDHAYVYPHSFYLLGKIYEKKGNTQLAIENTEKFLDLWKDADEDLPDFIDAKTRLARLKESTKK